MRIPFTLDKWLADKSQKVETRDGRPARIICTDMKDFVYPIVALITGKDDREYFISCTDKGLYCVSYESGDDLLLVTTELELTGFYEEYKRLYSEGYADGKAGSKPLSEAVLKESAAELLAIAEKELETKQSLSSDMKGLAYGLGMHKGVEEALKDLPMWTKAQFKPGNAAIYINDLKGNDYVIRNGWMISISDLEKLPKEE